MPSISASESYIVQLIGMGKLNKHCTNFIIAMYISIIIKCGNSK